ncbi:MAG: recombinase family protein [Colwellia sp.]|jgi:Site-specific recombinases, DNA invertase Pin homologs
MFIRAYLRASTQEQDASRAKDALIQFAESHGHKIAAFYIENESGTVRDRPELQRVLKDAHVDDIILVEQVDRLSRLNEKDWNSLKAAISEVGLKIVSVDLPTSHSALSAIANDDFTAQMLKAINNMLLDMLAVIARKDYEDRRRRQTEGIERNRDKFKGRPANVEKHAQVISLKEKGCSLTEIQGLTGYSRATVARVLKMHREREIN